MKYTSLSASERQLLGLRKASDLNNPEKAGRAAAYIMAKNYDYFKRLQNTYPELGLTNNDLRYLTELSYNQGMSKLKNIGFKDGVIAPEEIETIRELAKKGAKIKDVTSTNYKYLGKLGELLYDTFGTLFTPYISAAGSYREKLASKANQNR